MEFFKGDETELKFYNSADEAFENTSAQLTLFNEGAYTCYVLGDALWLTGRSPLSNAIIQDIFRESFPSLFEAFVVSGTFESYLNVFRQIFGADVEVTFTVPDPGKLVIDIVATGFEISNFVAREIDDDAYVFYNMLTQDNNQIVFQTVKGFETQYELEQMLFELVPAGIFTDINLTI